MNLINLLILTIIYSLSIEADNSINQCKLFDKFSSGYCSYVSSFNELDPSGCPAPYDSFDFSLLYGAICFKATTPLILDQTLQLNKIIDILTHGYNSIEVDFYNIFGFDLNFMSHFTPFGSPFIQFINSRFDFYMNGEKLDTSCNNLNWLNMYNYSRNILDLSRDHLIIKNSKFPIDLCPSVFHMLDVDTFEVFGNQIIFYTQPWPFYNKISTTVSYFGIKFSYKLTLTNQTLHPALFANITALSITDSSVYTFQVDLFKNFNSLKDIHFRPSNLRFFFHHNKMDWIYHLNNKSLNSFYLNLYDQNKDLATKYIFKEAVRLNIHNHVNDNGLYPVEFFPYLEYQYPNEDFCLFDSFPHENLITPFLLGPYSEYQCSCTLQWLFYYTHLYINVGVLPKDLINNTNLTYPVYHICFYNTSIGCNLTTLIQQCNISNNISYQEEYFNMYDLKDTVKAIQSALLEISGPIVAAIAILTNLLVIITIKKAPKASNPLKQSICDSMMYKYMLLNAVTNLIYSLLFFFVYTVKCKMESSDNHGSVPDTCFQEQIYVDIAGSILKLMSNFSFLQLCLNRFLLVGLNHYEFIEKIAQIRPTIFTCISVVVSGLLSVVIYFEQEFFGSQSNSSGHVISEDYYYHNYYWYTHYKSYFMSIVVDKLKQLVVLSTFMLIHDFFSYAFFCLASTLIDILTVKNLRSVLQSKKKKSSVDHDKEAQKCEIKSITMIVLSSLCNFLLRFPELFSIIFFYTLLFNKQSHYIFKTLCYAYRECLPIIEMTNVFYLLALSINFVLYVSFDKNFKESFIHLATSFFNFLFKRLVKKVPK